MIRTKKTRQSIASAGYASKKTAASMMLFTAMFACSISAAFADGAIPTFSPDSHHVVSFDYSPQSVFSIKTEPHMVTDLRLKPGENMEMLILGNTAQWITASAPGNVFLKPTKPGLTTSGTLVTNLRTYQLLITSSNNGNWYQQVSWDSGAMVALQNNSPTFAPPPSPAAISKEISLIKKQHSESAGQSGNIKAVSNLHFNYKIEGHASFRPSEVFDNGTFTWIKIPDAGNGAMPVVFVYSHGEYVITNYTVKGRYLIVQQLFKKAKLRIGNRVVTITKEQ